MASVGLSVFEGVANGLSPFVLPSKHNIGLLMGRERGIPFKAKEITSLQEDRLFFGGLTENYYGAYCTRNLYKNAGEFGAFIYGVRMFDLGFITSPDDYTSKGVLTDGAPSNQDFSLVVTVPHTATDKAKATLTVSDISEGDTITLTSGVTSIGHVVAEGESIADVHNALKVLIDAEITAVNADFTKYVWTVEASGSYLEVEEKVVNVPLDLTLSTSNGSAVPIFSLFAGQTGQKDPGTWGNSLKVVVYPLGHELGDKNNYLLEVVYKNLIVESFTAITFPKLMGIANELSNYITAEAGASINSASIVDIQTVILTGGSNGTAIEETSFQPNELSGIKTGLSALDGAEVNIIANTEFHTKTAAQFLNDYCAERKDPIGVALYPYLATDTVIEDFANSLQTSETSFLAMYDLWNRTSDEEGAYSWVPGIGTILGAGFIRVPKLNRDLIFIPPAGTESRFRDVVDISPNNLSQKKIDRRVQRFGCNVAVFKTGKGFFLFSSRTMSSTPLYHSIHIRRQTSFYVTAIEDNLLFAIQKPLDVALQKDIYASLLSYFRGEYNSGGLERSIPFEEACQIVNDKTVNPATQDRKLHNVEINWIPTECTESMVIRLNRNDGSLIAESV